MKSFFILLTLLLALIAPNASASIAYGSVNNFDTVNDTTHECHGFEIELDDCHSTDITYTYNYNHYGAPEITEDLSDSVHPKVFIRWKSKKNADGSWAAYTAIPAGPISPTNGHMFTNPAVNFGGEHFGVGYRLQPSAVLYNWLIDNGSGTLVHGGAVQVSTPTFTYYPPVAAAPAQVQAVIAPPPPPAPPPKQFGKAVWVKEIKTTTHNAGKIKLRELVSDDPDNPNDKNWKNGEPDEVEVEWRILQKNTGAADGGVNNNVVAAAEPLPNGNEVVTRRYEFYTYMGPLDAETGEAMGDLVGADGSHGSGTVTYADHYDNALGEWVTITTDMSTKVIVGDFTGSQMAAVDVDEPVGLIDHVGDGQVNKAIAARSVVIEGALPFTSIQEGALPPGLAFDETTGVLSGTPTASGTYNFKVTAYDSVSPDVAKNYTMQIAAVGAALAPASLLDTAASPVGTGTTTGDGSYDVGTNATVTATAEVGYAFVNWTDNGQEVSINPSYTLAMDVNHSLVANFVPDVPQWLITSSALPALAGSTAGDATYLDGDSVTLTATANAGFVFSNWTEGGTVVSSSASYTFFASADRVLVANFIAVPSYTISTSAAPTAGGSTSGGGSYVQGSSVTVTATTNAGYQFVNWTVGGTQLSASASYTFTATANRSLVANFVLTGGTLRTITTGVTPAGSGTTTGGGTYADGTSVTLIATANPGYAFSKWKNGSSNASSSASYTFVVSADVNLVANFNAAWSITASAAPIAGGTTEMDSSTYKVGDTVQALATPNANYQFVNWTDNGTIVSTANPYSFPATGNRTLVANFQLAGGVTVSTSSAPVAGGTTSGGGNFASGSSVTVVATPNANYSFDNWTVSGAVVSSSASYTFTATANRSLVANFSVAPTTWTITTNAQPSAGGSITGDGAGFVDGEQVTLSASASAGYSFVNWTEAGTEVSTSPNYSFTATADRTLDANFALTSTGVKFDFDSTPTPVALGQTLPLSQMSAGITASFSSPNGDDFSIGDSTSTGFALATLTGKYLVPSTNGGSALDIQFDQSVTDITVNFALSELLNLAPHSTLKITATNSFGANGPEVVGSNTAVGANHAGDSLATGTLSFSNVQAFDQIRIEVITAAAAGAGFLIDCMTVTPVPSGGSLMLGNPSWNITLTDAGYSDLLLDNTPGFVGREYLSGEWGAAVGYVKGATTRSPKWLERNFIFPDWTTNSDFNVVSPIALIGSNADGLPVAQSVIANSDLEVTIRYEMLDTVTGMPMGIHAASAGGTGDSINSSRYVLNQSYTIKNISGASISNLQVFQMLHGFTSQHGVYDSATYAGKQSDYHYDVTLGGIDATTIGAEGSSSTGLEDFIGFGGKVAPSAYEIGHYGIEGNGLDDHSVGKPSDGVHLSIENNWSSAPYLSRKNRDYFAPANRWIAGAQRYELGTLADGQTASVDVMMSIRTGTTVTITGGGGAGNTGSGSCNGGSTKVGGVDFEIEGIETEGTFFGEESEAEDEEVNERIANGEFVLPNFSEPGGLSQVWNLKYSGTHSGNIRLKFNYDPALLPAGYDASRLTIWHFTNGAWEQLVGIVDTVHHTITVTTSSLSPFMLGMPTANAVPKINATNTGPGSQQLQWVSDTTGWVLQESPDLVNWTNSARVVNTVGGVSTVTVSGAGSCCFFRLGHP